MKLYGTTTSPYVRRVRIIAAEVAAPLELVDTASPAGQDALRAVTPIRKVPVATFADGRTLFDSRAILDHVDTTHAWRATLDPKRHRLDEHNLVNAIDGALDAVIQLFYLRRDGVAIDGTPYATRQLERADAIFAWLAARLAAGELSTASPGLPETSICCTLDWMEFRDSYPTERAAALAPIRAAFRDRPTFAATRPHA
nr:glutathione S-transferase family protein [Kofleriaceae bacterium]